MHTMGNSSNPDASIIIPAYNAEKTIDRAIVSALAQEGTHCSIEVIVVNDGSTDETKSICESYASKKENVVVINQENAGVSAARNVALDRANGRYITFLDSDDYFDPNTIRDGVAFFDKYYDLTDVVSYPMIITTKAGVEHSHIRERILYKTGIYDLKNIKNAFALITNVNVIIKNDDCTPRFDEALVVHEDEQFLMSLLLGKQTVGFCKSGAYRYNQNPDSAINTIMHPYYQFENNIGFWEAFFNRYELPPLYLQASFVNEINWKIKSDMLYPYHYSEQGLSMAKQRIENLMKKIDDEVILNAPGSDNYFNQYFFDMKYDSFDVSCSSKGLAISKFGKLLECENHIEMLVTKSRFVNDDTWELDGVLRSSVFKYLGKPSFFAEVFAKGDICKTVPVELSFSSLSRHRTHILTNSFWCFHLEINCREVKSISFSCMVGNSRPPLKLFFSQRAQFNWYYQLLTITHGDVSVAFDLALGGFVISDGLSKREIQKLSSKANSQVFRRSKRGMLIRRALKTMEKEHPIWLYYDRKGLKDNSYYQFVHDFDKVDGIERYYISDNSQEDLARMFPDANMRKHVIPFSSKRHKLIHLQADKIIVAYAEPENWRPYSASSISKFSDIINYELVYLQHGILHAHTPWKYSADRLCVDREVVSSGYEIDNFMKNYGFRRSQLIDSGMPRYDAIEHASSAKHPSKTIVYAPSWRKYLVSQSKNLTFEPKEKAFVDSRYWKETSRLLADTRLTETLEKHRIKLQIKLHPIFSGYLSHFKSFENDVIVVCESAGPSECDLLITDYSSWVFDFVYAGCAIAYFFPDLDEFNAGLNGYHKLDMPISNGFGPLATCHDELIDLIIEFCNHGSIYEQYRENIDRFFLHYDNHQRDRLYAALMKK